MRNLRRISVVFIATAFFIMGFSTAASAAVPTVNEVDQAGNQVQIKGQNLGNATNVMFDTKSAASIRVVSDNEVDATAPALAVGFYEIYVVAAGTTLDTGIPFTVSPPAPTITSLSRTSGTTAGGDTIVVKGKNLSLVRMISLAGPPANYDAKSDTEIDIITAPHSPGEVTLSITTYGGTAQHSFTYVAPAHAAPIISSTTPDHGYIGGNTPVTIHGAGLRSVKSVTFLGIPAKSFTIISDSQINAISPIATTGGIGALTVSNGTSTATARWKYNYVNPWITGITPSGSKHGGTTITINGFGFTGVTTVTVNAKPATITSLADKHIVIQVPKHKEGTIRITVTNPAATSNTASYTYKSD